MLRSIGCALIIFVIMFGVMIVPKLLENLF